MDMIGVGVVGCGNISTIYLQNLPLYKGVALRACADMRPEVAKAQAEKFGIDANTVEELLARPDIQVVVNLTVPNAHFDVSLAAIRAGKHVFSEKPLTVSVAQGRQLVEEAAQRGVKIGCAPDTFIGAGGRLARQLVDEGAIGRIVGGTAIFMTHGMEHWHPDPEFFFKPGGGPVLDIGPYYITALVNLIGPVRRVMAMASAAFAERVVTAKSPKSGARIAVETPTSVSALLEFENGAQLTVIMTWDVWKHGHPPIEIYGTEGSLRVPDPNFFGGEVEITDKGGDWKKFDSSGMPFGKPNWRSPNWPADAPSRANYRGLGVAELINSVRTGAPHRASGDLALHVLEVMYAILQSSETNHPVTIPAGFHRPETLADAEAATFM
jgi:predicted dehydrogenase